MNIKITPKKPETREPIAAVTSGIIYVPSSEGKSVVATTGFNKTNKMVAIGMKEATFGEWCEKRSHMKPVYEGDTLEITL